jgi:hypothetical protein
MKYLTILLVPFVFGFNWTIQDKIFVFHPAIVAQIQDHGLSGPIAKEVAPYAQLRCIHEDGEKRNHNESCNGMVPGSPNKEVMEKLCMPGCTLGKVTANDGQGCYVIKGPKAHVMSSVAIGLWFDAMIQKLGSREEKDLWNEAKHCSHMIAISHPDPIHERRFEVLREYVEHLVKKYNSMYGPQGKAIEQNKRRYFD